MIRPTLRWTRLGRDGDEEPSGYHLRRRLGLGEVLDRLGLVRLVLGRRHHRRPRKQRWRGYSWSHQWQS